MHNCLRTLFLTQKSCLHRGQRTSYNNIYTFKPVGPAQRILSYYSLAAISDDLRNLIGRFEVLGLRTELSDIPVRPYVCKDHELKKA